MNAHRHSSHLETTTRTRSVGEGREGGSRGETSTRVHDPNLSRICTQTPSSTFTSHRFPPPGPVVSGEIPAVSPVPDQVP